jgi:mono/diheme cytochrome c family protein
MMGKKLAAMVLVVGLLLAACGGGASPDVTKVRNADSVAAGIALYEANCAACHGSDLRGGSFSGGIAPSLTGKTGPSDALLIEIVKRGRGLGMPSFASQLEETEIASIIDYVRSVQASLIDD